MSNVKVRRRKKSSRGAGDGKGDRRMIAGKRFRTPGLPPGDESSRRLDRIDQLWLENEAFCNRVRRDVEWTDIALWAADALRHGKVRIPLPSIDDVLASFGDAPYRIDIKHIIDRYTDDTLACNYPPEIEGLSWDEAKKFYDQLSEFFPSINWCLPERHSQEILDSHEKQARYSIERFADAQGAAPPAPNTPLVSGNLHEALESFEAERKKGFTLPDGTFNGSGHHMLGMIRSFRERQPDMMLSQLDYSRCQSLIDFWRERPSDLRKKSVVPLTKKTCRNYIGELIRFFKWLHLTTDFNWRRPSDFDLLNKQVRELPSDRKSLDDMEVATYSVDHLATLFRVAIPFERLLMAWCLNCAHGAAEFGRVEWGDILLHQEHPWVKKGLTLESSSQDSWCGFLRPKSGVLGWWLLWPETVALLEWWRAEITKTLGREPRLTERVLLTGKGTPLYRDESRNAQTGFANLWTRLHKRVEKNASNDDQIEEKLPFGTLRDQMSDWLGGEQAKALVASVALAHGIPHSGDKLLYRHYSNRPWRALFESQREYREHLFPMFAAVPDLLGEPDPVAEKVQSLWTAGVRSVTKIANCLEVSEVTVRRRLKSLGLE